MYRTIKSYVLRAGRVSNRQQQGLDLWLQDYLLEPMGAPWDFEQIFGREADTWVEIGFGMGASLCAMAEASPHRNYVGIEVHQAGVGSLAAMLHDKQLTNVRIVPHNAVDIFNKHIAAESLEGVQIFFPDPWPKKRHHKRRLVQKDFINCMLPTLKKNGYIHCATDWEEYAAWMLEALSSIDSLYNTADNGGYAPRPNSRPLTKFEARGERLGHGVWDLIFAKK